MSPGIKTVSRISQNQCIGNLGGNLDDIAAQFDAALLAGIVNPGFCSLEMQPGVKLVAAFER